MTDAQSLWVIINCHSMALIHLWCFSFSILFVKCWFGLLLVMLLIVKTLPLVLVSSGLTFVTENAAKHCVKSPIAHQDPDSPSFLLLTHSALARFSVGSNQGDTHFVTSYHCDDTSAPSLTPTGRQKLYITSVKKIIVNIFAKWSKDLIFHNVTQKKCWIIEKYNFEGRRLEKHLKWMS